MKTGRGYYPRPEFLDTKGDKHVSSRNFCRSVCPWQSPNAHAMGRSAIHAQTGRMGFYILRTQGNRLADAPPDGDVLRLIGTRVTVKPLVLLRHAQSP